jgi:hypothetical protein
MDENGKELQWVSTDGATRMLGTNERIVQAYSPT